MANFATVKTFGGLSGEKHPIIHAVVGKINVVREDNIGFNQNICLPTKRQNMTQICFLNSQGNGPDRGNQLTKIRDVIRKNGVRDLGVNIGEDNTGGRSDKGGDLNVLIVVLKTVQDGVFDFSTGTQIYSNTPI